MAVSIQLCSFAEGLYFPSLAINDSSYMEEQAQPVIERPSASSKTDLKDKYIKNVEIHGLNVLSEGEILSKLNLVKIMIIC